MADTETEDAGKAANANTSEQGDMSFDEMVRLEVKAYLDEHLEELVQAAMPLSPAEQAALDRENAEEAAKKRAAAAKRKATKQAKDAEKAAAEAAEKRAKLDAEAAKAFEDAVPFTGKVSDIKPTIIRGIKIDNGRAYSADHHIDVDLAHFDPFGHNSLLLTKEISLPGKGREFVVKGVSLVTDAGVLRTELNGTRKCGGGNAVSFPAKSLVFTPAKVVVEPADA